MEKDIARNVQTGSKERIFYICTLKQVIQVVKSLGES